MPYRELGRIEPAFKAERPEYHSPWHRFCCKIERHPVKFCHFLVVKKVIYHTLSPDNVLVIFYNPSKVFCRCCSTLLDRSKFSAKAIAELECATARPLNGWIRRSIVEESDFIPDGRLVPVYIPDYEDS
jgi:hypothetical protein